MAQGAKVPIAKPHLGEDEVAAVAEVLRSGWITQGPKVAAFEEAFAAFTGAEQACAVSSCTTALHLALLVAGVGAGDEVITVSHSFIASANAVRYVGALPVFVDIEPGTYNIDPALVEPAISRRTKAILCVHQMGMPCDLPALKQIAELHGLVLIEDAACAAGSEILVDGEARRIGYALGDIACFSFHPRKIMSTGDGGMITTSRADWAERCRRLRQHAMSLPDTLRHGSSEVLFEEYGELGYNYRMTDIQAAIGLVQLERLPEMVALRRRRAARYRSLLGDIPGLGLPLEPNWALSNWQSYCVALPAGVDQRRAMQSMLDQGIATRRGIMCAHREPAYAAAAGAVPAWRCADTAGDGRALAKSEAAQDHSIVLPLYHAMSDEEQDRVAEALSSACRA